MATSPPDSPGPASRPVSVAMRPPRTNSRMSMTSRPQGANGGGSRASDEDGKTSVKVAVRVRPPLRPTDPGFELIPQRFQRSMVQVISPTSLAIDSPPQGRKLFVFDRVFGEDVTQEGIWEYLVESTNAFVQGYNVSMLAYGQSGAGKSYTMGTSGPDEQSEMDVMGVIPRAARELFDKLGGPSPAQSRASTSGLKAPNRYSINAASMLSRAEKSWTLKATYVEIYNEHLRDLLVPENTPAGERRTVTIREDTKGHILLTGLQEVEIHSVDDLMSALNFGSMIRQTDSTAINAKSSRSHAVFSLNLVQRKPKSTTAAEKRFSVPLEALTGGETMVTIDSKLHFVDLAGSERLKNTGAQGERAKEGISINAGLASLGKVISQLSSRQAGSHVSYRDSKLTRLLQDSLGGNAITYMIACVTPAEFHLSETLNTVQYAQRARAIQSKPRIQQISDETDKQAVIDRLKAEVAFLREQIRSQERPGDRHGANLDRSERPNDKEVDLQNQLLDFQENYTTLSQRHAKLIAELAKARDEEKAEELNWEHSMGDSATERLKRSNSFAEAVEKVVMEYEKTIQTLEQSLSSTRSSLSNTETNLLEKETKCAYVETVNQQLNTRLQKMMDRESNTENYLRDLESKLDGHTSGEEQNSAIIMELRKEIARVRESEANCEDYISTLEERLAEADQEAELQQRERERLEHIIERQRSIGKLDSLLYDLDHIQQENGESQPAANGRPLSHQSRPSRSSGSKDVILEENISENGTDRTVEAPRSAREGPVDAGEPIEEESAAADIDLAPATQNGHVAPQSPAQTRFVEDKLENVSQELFDLKVEHESVIHEHDVLAAKYEEALRALAELQDIVDESRHNKNRDSVLSVSTPITTRPTSFLENVQDQKDGLQHRASRSLLLDLSSAGGLHSPSLPSPFAASEVSGIRSESDEPDNDNDLLAEIEGLKRLAAAKEEAEGIQYQRYAKLEEEHVETLELLEELRTEIVKAKTGGNASRSSTPGVIRRKSSQNVMIIDRAHRSFASLRNIATESFEDKPDVMANFELHLNAAMHELYTRSERVQELEADIASTKKDLDAKKELLTGLTRERSSMKSPLDMSMVSSMRDELIQSENQMRMLQETLGAREKELSAEIESLHATIGAHGPLVADKERAIAEHEDRIKAQDSKITTLEAQLLSWEELHHTTLDTMEQTNKDLKMEYTTLQKKLAQLEESQAETKPDESLTAEPTIAFAELEQAISQLEASHAVKLSELAQSHATKLSELEESHTTKISALEHSHMATASGFEQSRAAQVSDLEQSHASTQGQLEEVTKSRDVALADLEGHRSLISQLELQISEHESVVKGHQDGMDLLRETHARELKELESSTVTDHEARMSQLATEHSEKTKALEGELEEARENLSTIATQVAFALGVDVSTEKLQDRINGLLADQNALQAEQSKGVKMEGTVAELSAINDTVMKELAAVKAQVASLTEEVAAGAQVKTEHTTLSEQVESLKKEMVELEAQNKKSSRLVEELEDQLATNFDQHQATTNRLSTLQSERSTEQNRISAELAAIKEDYASLQTKYDEVLGGEIAGKRTNSITAVRKTTSTASLPSPPPAIPLPPLPMGSLGSVGNAPNVPVPATPVVGNRPTSRELAMAQIQEDQEARLRTIEKHLTAEKQLTQTLEEALTDLERQSNKIKGDCDAWRRRAGELETELVQTRTDLANSNNEKEQRWSLLQVEEERKKRRDAEVARANLEERMNALNKKKKKGSLNCF